MLQLFTAFANSDGAAIAEATLKFSGAQQKCPDPAAFVAAINSRFLEIEAENARNQANNGAEALNSLLDVVRQHQVSSASPLSSLCCFTALL